MDGDIGIAYGEQHHDKRGNTEIVTASTQNVTYTAHISGNWATWMSQYLWNSSLKDYSTSGSLYHLNGIGLPTEADIPVLPNTYVGANVDSDRNGLIIPNEAGTTGTIDRISFTFRNGDNRPNYATGNDGDGAVAGASYVMTIHQPIEVFPSHRPDEYNHYRIATPKPQQGSDDILMSFQGVDYSIYKGSTGVPVPLNGISASCVINSPNVDWALASDVTSILSSVPYPGYWAVLDVIFAGANIYANHAATTPQIFNADFNDIAWNDPQSTGDANWVLKKGTRANYRMSPRVRVQYKWQYKLVDTYGPSGFISETLQSVKTYMGPHDAFGYFVYQSP